MGAWKGGSALWGKGEQCERVKNGRKKKSCLWSAGIGKSGQERGGRRGAENH